MIKFSLFLDVTDNRHQAIEDIAHLQGKS